MKVVKVIYDRVSNIRTTMVTHTPQKSEEQGLLHIPEIAGTSDFLIQTMLASDRVDLINHPREWMAESKVFKMLVNSTMKKLKEGDLSQRELAGRMNGSQMLKMRLWARAYYLSVRKAGHVTSKKVIAQKARDLLLADGFKEYVQKDLKEDEKDFRPHDESVPSVRTIAERWFDDSPIVEMKDELP